MVCAKFLLIFLWAVGNVDAAKKLPDYFPTCYQNEKDLNECLLNATETVRPFLKAGVPELNLKPLSPFVIPCVSIDPETNSIQYHAEARNLTSYGLDSYHFTKFNFDPETLRFEIAVEIPALYLEGTISVNGRLLGISLGGEGSFRSNFTQSSGTLEAQGVLVERKNVKYLEYSEIKPHVNVGEVVEYHLDGLFDDNPVLEKIMRQTIDENMKVLIEEFRPTMDAVLSQLFRDYLLKSFSKIPYEQLYPISNNKIE